MAALSREQIEQLTAAMQRRREELLGEIRLVRERVEDHSARAVAGVPDSGDESATNLSADVDNAAADRDLQELRDIEAAFVRLAAGEYGVCVDCGQDIGFARLNLSPAVSRCVPCQERREKTYAGGATPSL